MNVHSFVFIDPSMFAATLLLKYAKYYEADPLNGALQKIALRSAAEGDAAILQEWPFARKLIEQMGLSISKYLGGNEVAFGDAMVTSLAPGCTTPWLADASTYAAAHMRFILPVTPCAWAWLYCGGEAVAPAPGNLTFLNTGAMHSFANFGPAPMVNMVLDVRRPQLQ